MSKKLSIFMGRIYIKIAHYLICKVWAPSSLEEAFVDDALWALKNLKRIY